MVSVHIHIIKSLHILRMCLKTLLSSEKTPGREHQETSDVLSIKHHSAATDVIGDALVRRLVSTVVEVLLFSRM